MRGHRIPYSADEMAWLEVNRTMAIADYHRAFSVAFSRADVTPGDLHALRKRKGWKTGRSGRFEKGSVSHNKGKPFPVAAHHPNCRRTQFKRGQEPHNTKFAGHERVSKDGYVEISIEETNPHTGYHRRYVLKHKWRWEKANGPIPSGFALKCLDGDRLNTDPSNWEVVPRAVLPRLNGGRHKTRISYDAAPADLKPTLMAVAKLEHAVATRRDSTSGCADAD